MNYAKTTKVFKKEEIFLKFVLFLRVCTLIQFFLKT